MTNCTDVVTMKLYPVMFLSTSHKYNLKISVVRTQDDYKICKN